METTKSPLARKRAELKAERAARKARIAAAKAATAAVVATGKCPDCGAKLRRNLALTGWYQCEQFGADGHRADNSKPKCDWQGFV